MKKLIYKLVGLGLNLWSLVAPKAAARKAYQLFGKPPKPNFRTKEKEFLDGSTQINSTIADHQIVEYHWGPADGPLVLLTYGWNYNAGRWRHFVPDLVKAGFHVLAYDPPGHGRNKHGNMLNVLINSNIQQGLIHKYGQAEILIGHSFGGACAVYTIKSLPVQLQPKRAVIMASFSNAPRLFSEYRHAIGLWESVYYGMVRHLESKIGMPLNTFDMARMSSQLGRVETLLVHDPKDTVTPFSNALRYHAYWPDSLLLEAENAGHHLGTAAITDAVLQFAMYGAKPQTAIINEKPLDADHDLIRYFAGLEF